MHCTLLLGFASRWTHRKAMNLSGHSLQRYEAKQIWLARLCSVPNFDRGWLEMVLHNHSFTLFTSYRQPNATVNECEWAMCNSCLATSITFFFYHFSSVPSAIPGSRADRLQTPCDARGSAIGWWGVHASIENVVKLQVLPATPQETW
jgi:hypothetical protein